jgi:phage FluMu protein Com
VDKYINYIDYILNQSIDNIKLATHPMFKTIAHIGNREYLKVKCPSCGRTDLLPIKGKSVCYAFKCECGYVDAVVKKI